MRLLLQDDRKDHLGRIALEAALAAFRTIAAR
jgi:hypothetical protein